MTPICAQCSAMIDEISALAADGPASVWVEWDDDSSAYGVWVGRSGSSDLIGKGATRYAAIDDAMTQAREEAREYDLLKSRAIDALMAAGLTTEDACLCVRQLCSGAADAFARAYTYVAAHCTANEFRAWCVTHGFRDVVGETERQPKRADACESCGGAVEIRDAQAIRRRGHQVSFRCRRCRTRKTTLAGILRELAADGGGNED